MCDLSIPIIFMLIGLADDTILPHQNSDQFWAGEHTIRYNAMLLTYPNYAVHMLLVAENHQHEVGMFFSLYTRLCNQQTGTGHRILGHSRAGWRCNTGVYTRGLWDVTETCNALAITTETIQWSIGVSLFTRIT